MTELAIRFGMSEGTLEKLSSYDIGAVRGISMARELLEMPPEFSLVATALVKASVAGGQVLERTAQRMGQQVLRRTDDVAGAAMPRVLADDFVSPLMGGGAGTTARAAVPVPQPNLQGVHARPSQLGGLGDAVRQRQPGTQQVLQQADAAPVQEGFMARLRGRLRGGKGNAQDAAAAAPAKARAQEVPDTYAESPLTRKAGRQLKGGNAAAPQTVHVAYDVDGVVREGPAVGSGGAWKARASGQGADIPNPTPQPAPPGRMASLVQRYPMASVLTAAGGGLGVAGLASSGGGQQQQQYPQQQQYYG